MTVSREQQLQWANDQLNDLIIVRNRTIQLQRAALKKQKAENQDLIERILHSRIVWKTVAILEFLLVILATVAGARRCQ